MSVKRALNIVDGLLDVLDEADKRAAAAKADAPAAASSSSAKVTYFAESEDVKEGKSIKVTTDKALFAKEWAEAELGENDEKDAYLGCIGKVTEVEDDGTIQVRWENYDTCWLPARACSDAGNAAPTLPSLANSWLGDSATNDDEKKEPAAAPVEKKEEEKTSSAVSGKLYTSAEDEGVKVGAHMRITSDAAILDKEWKSSELGPNDEKGNYLGAVGKVMEVEEDDDTVQLRWENFDTCWIPVRACMDAGDAKPTCPVFLSHME